MLEPNPDILAELGRRRRPGQVVVGFAAETGDHLAGARRKLKAKHLDLVVLNHVEGANSAFGADDADAYLVDADTVEELPGPPRRPSPPASSTGSRPSAAPPPAPPQPEPTLTGMNRSVPI